MASTEVSKLLVLVAVMSLGAGTWIQCLFSNFARESLGTLTSDDKRTNHDIDAEQFHITNYERIRAIVSDSTLMAWAPGFEQFVAEFGFDSVLSDDSVEKRAKIWRSTTREVVIAKTVCEAALDFNRTGKVKPHVLLSFFNENWGALSTQIRNRTFEWGDLELRWRHEGCSTRFIFDYLNHPSTLAVITVQFQAYDHPKVHSIPLGVKGKPQFLEQLKKPRQNRTNLLMVNHNNAVQYRADISDMVISNFNGSVSNTYHREKREASREEREAFYDEMLNSKFILSPGGVGWDCYRNWESLYLGTVPIIEHYNRTDGWRRTFDGLPVLFVDHYNELTPGLLETEYERIAARANDYNYERLSSRWWVDFVNSFL